MSKYIRTDKGIFEFKSNMFIEDAVYYCFGKFEKTDKKHLFRNDKDLGEIVNQADTIEELCDEFVIIYKDEYKYYANTDKPFITNNKPYTLKSRTEEKLKYFNYYGAIWTDKGLIYVAKMNEKGDLELI